MTNNPNHTKSVNTPLSGDVLADFELVKQHHGMNTNNDVVRYLIRQEARKLRAVTSPLPIISDMVIGWLTERITADEAMKTIAGQQLPLSGWQPGNRR